jgi:ABC-type transporter Mla subunit MlaD
MPEIVITDNPDGTHSGEVIGESIEHEEAEVNQWQEFSNVLSQQTTALDRLATVVSDLASQTQAMSARVPENLVSMLQTQEQTIRDLVSESMATVRTLLTPPAVAVVENPPAPVVEEVVPPVAANPEPERRRRRGI